VNGHSKLPKWARDELRSLAMRLEEARSEIALLKGERITTVVADPHADMRQPGAKPRYLEETDAVRFAVGRGWIEVCRNRNGGLSRDEVSVSASRMLRIYAQSGNVVYVTDDWER
jgi:hypothetical protein